MRRAAPSSTKAVLRAANPEAPSPAMRSNPGDREVGPVCLQRCGDAHRLHPRGQPVGVGQPGNEAAVGENQQGRGPFQGVRLDIGGAHRSPRGAGSKRHPRHHLRVGVAPALVPAGRQPVLGEVVGRLPPQGVEGGAGASVQPLLELPEAVEVPLPAVVLLPPGPAHAPASAVSLRTHSYPFRSSWRASSLPPERAMRPSISTCTTSGIMYCSSRW